MQHTATLGNTLQHTAAHRDTVPRYGFHVHLSLIVSMIKRCRCILHDNMYVYVFVYVYVYVYVSVSNVRSRFNLPYIDICVLNMYCTYFPGKLLVRFIVYLPLMYLPLYLYICMCACKIHCVNMYCTSILGEAW